jgi:AcrR family transcriptional regulator
MTKPAAGRRRAEGGLVRGRRTAEEARRATGPAALRLQDVAADVGISHPAVLHHFGSREGLVRGVIERAVVRLQHDLVTTLGASGGGPPSGEALFERVFETLFAGGHGRLIAWLALSGYDPFDAPALRENWAQIGEFTHALRAASCEGGRRPRYEDTRFTILLSALALFGQAVVGGAAFRAAGFEPDEGAERRFRRWLAKLLARHLKEG